METEQVRLPPCHLRLPSVITSEAGAPPPPSTPGTPSCRRLGAHSAARALPCLERLISPICNVFIKNLSSVRALSQEAP